VICSAFDPAGNLGHPSLLIEVAVTHKVDAQKRRKIIEAGLACLELDAGQLAVSGRIHRQDLAAIVSAGKALSWVYHEEIERLRSEAEANCSAYLAEQDRQDRLRNEAARLAIRNREEREALEKLTLKQLYQLLFECLEAKWSGNPEGFTLFNGLGVNSNRVISAIQRFRPSFEYVPGLMDIDGALPILLMRGVPLSSPDHHDFIVGQIRRFSLASESYSKFVTLLLLAVKAGIAAVDDRVYQRIARSLQNSAAKKRGAYARPTGYDEFVLQVVPRMAWVLSEQRRKMDARKEVRDAVESRKQEIILKQTQHKNRQIEAMRQREERRKLIAQFAQGGWAPRGGLPIDEEQAIQLAKGERVMYVDRIEIVRKAWRAREGGVSIFDFYNNLGLSHTVAFKEVQKLLSAAYIQIT
jgi:predicted GNAT superfamily acetyltransferase